MNEVKMKKCSKCGRELPATKEYFHSDKTRPDGFSYVCKECKSVKKLKSVPDGYKKCKQCHSILELNDSNFNTHKKSKDGFMNICKSCQFENRGRHVNDKYKVCIKCERRLPANQDFFLKDKGCLDGLRNICRECSGGNFYPREQIEWTIDEKEILIKNYSYMSNKELVEKFFPYRKEYSIGDYATKTLGLYKDEEYIKYRTWSKEQLNLLIENYSFTDMEKLVELIGKNADLISVKASDLGLKKEFWWTEEEEQILKENYPYMKTKELIKKYFQERNYQSVVNKARQLNLYKDEEYLYNMKRAVGIRNLGDMPKLKGKNHPRWVKRVIIYCDQCGKDIITTPYNAQGQEHYFCSRECQGQWRSENLSGENSPIFGRASGFWTEEMKRKQAVVAIKRLRKLNYSSKPTKPQIIINNLLNDLEIKYENEYDCKYYLIDNYLSDYNLMIEVQGNFFHCNPVLNLKNNRKDKILAKDKAKHTYIKKYKNIEVLYLWEKDIINDLDKCKKLILKYIHNGGKLNNYHSFNYVLDDGMNLQLIESLYAIGY